MCVRVYLKIETSDGFIANIFFIIVILLGLPIYFILKDFLKTLDKKFFKKEEVVDSSNSNEVNSLRNFDILEEEKADINVIRKTQHQEKNQEENKKLQIATQYTKEKLALYVSDEDLIKLCEYIKLYSVKGSFSNFKPIKVDTLSTLDIYHFGWNIWKHFSVGKQENMACFLKYIFAELLKDVEVETIKKHLKDDELKGIIKIENPLIFKL